MPREVSSLADILADARVWKLKDASAAPARPVWSTGRSSLDARLPGGGWPTASLIEVLLDDTGFGEVQLFLPALVECQRGTSSRQRGCAPWLVWIAPPHEPYAPALAQQGIELGRLLVVRPASATEALWAAEQALSSGVCAAVLLWLKGTDDRWLRRLKLAAEAGGALGVLFRPERHRFESSPASLRLVDDAGSSMRRVSIYSRCKAAGPALSISVAREIAYCEIADGRFICRSTDCRDALPGTRTGTGTGVQPVSRSAGRRHKPAALKAALVCRGISGTDRSRTFRRRTAAALPACTNDLPPSSASSRPTLYCWKSRAA